MGDVPRCLSEWFRGLLGHGVVGMRYLEHPLAHFDGGNGGNTCRRCLYDHLHHSIIEEDENGVEGRKGGV